ncbi:MAG: HAD family hydrolase [Streptosporangiales bacterium]|nr:HAD family hydrolase [Streptosporangiales bacterium]
MAPVSDDPVRLAVWSGPRNISTALMRSWENRADTVVVDEPLYAYYLATTRLDHPARDEIVAAGETDWRRVVETLLGSVPAGTAVFYQKHMNGHLLPEVDRSWIRRLTNVLLIRDPREVVASYTKARASVTPDDIGLPQQVALYDELAAEDTPPPVIDAADFLRDPERHLRALCAYVGVEFSDRMLRWPSGRRESDGIWAPHWYAAVERSTGFAPYRPREVRLSGELARVAAACMPLYERLREATG